MKKITRSAAKKAPATKSAAAKPKPVLAKNKPAAKKPMLPAKKAAVPAKSAKTKPAGPDASGTVVNVWDGDPDSGLKMTKRPAATLTLGPLPVQIVGAEPKPGTYPADTANFRYWSAADSLRRAREFWKPFIPETANWHGSEPLKINLDAGEDLNAYYDRQSLSFFRGASKGGRTIYTAESPDIIFHEYGHAILDVLRPDLWDAALDEVASFHESFSDLSALLIALQLPSVREFVIKETGGHLYQTSVVSRLAGQFGNALHGINPHAAPADCLRNAVNLFFYQDPMHLPPSAPEGMLSSEPHSFSRVFTGGFFEAMAGMLRIHAPTRPTADDLLAVAQDAAQLLVKAARTSALSAAFYSEVSAQIIWAESALFGGKYEDVFRSAFVRRGLLSLDAVRSLKAEAMRAQTAKPTPAGADETPRGRDMMMRASAFGLGEGALVVRTASFSRRGAIAPAALDTGSTPVPGVEQATQSFLETLFRRGRVDFSQCKPGITAVSHAHVRRKTHYIIEQNGQFHLRRRCFDESPLDIY
jgi:Autoinducer binding domain